MRHIISLGAGVQSSTMALMAAHGEITPMPECAIFADTGWEPRAVYDWLEWLKESLPFPVHTVSAGNIREDQMSQRRTKAKGGAMERYASLPYFVLNADESIGAASRQCTQEYKIDPIERFMRRELLALKPRQRAPGTPIFSSWRGISADEAHRMKPSRQRWIFARHPLAMEKGMTRADCIQWMRRHAFPDPPRSSCIGCPFHSDYEWQSMKRDRPAEFADAVEFDAAIRKAGGKRGETFLHRTCKPLGEIDFDQRIDGGHVDMFGAECEGMCGV